MSSRINLPSAVGAFARSTFGRSVLTLAGLLLVLWGLASPSGRIRMVTAPAAIAWLAIVLLGHFPRLWRRLRFRVLLNIARMASALRRLLKPRPELEAMYAATAFVVVSGTMVSIADPHFEASGAAVLCASVGLSMLGLFTRQLRVDFQGVAPIL